MRRTKLTVRQREYSDRLWLLHVLGRPDFATETKILAAYLLVAAGTGGRRAHGIFHVVDSLVGLSTKLDEFQIKAALEEIQDAGLLLIRRKLDGVATMKLLDHDFPDHEFDLLHGIDMPLVP